MNNKRVAAFKNQLVITVIVLGAILLAIPIFIFGLMRILWDLFIFWARLRKPIVAKRNKVWAEATEVRLVDSAGKQTKNDRPGTVP